MEAHRKRLIGLITCLLVALPKVLSSENSIEVDPFRDESGLTLNLVYPNFAFGSNMLASRMHIPIPTAERFGPARLRNYRLDFASYSSRWDGAVATVVPTQGAETWGTLWAIDNSNLTDLENQIGVPQGIFKEETVYVEELKPDHRGLTEAHVYMLTQQPETNLYNLSRDSIPESRLPSKTYLQSLVKGAIESSLPEDYIQRLRRIKHNGRVAPEMEKQLQLQDFVL